MKYLHATVKALDDAGTGSFEAIASTTAVDRDGEVVAARAFDPLPQSIPTHVDHKMSSEGLVGTSRPFYDASGALRVRGTFAGTPRAQVIRQLVLEGHLSTMSVGFFGATYDKAAAGPPTITRAELLEVSFVTVPSNRGALVTASRSFDMTAGQRAIAKAKVQATLALAELVLTDDEYRSRKVATAADGRRVLAETRALLAQLEGDR